MKRPNGYVLHKDSKRIVIATGFHRVSENEKTGPMVQVYILAKAAKPTEAVKRGLDTLVCVDCPSMGVKGAQRTCYVNVGQGPGVVYREWKKGKYPTLSDLSVFKGKRVRFGAYGEPVMIPFDLLAAIAAASDGWTGYTHQWRNPLFSAYRAYLMASVETDAGAKEALARGWRYFRATDSLSTLGAKEIICPNTTHGIQCHDCRLCAGTSKGAASIVIEVHGSGKVHYSAAAGIPNQKPLA
jgi:hypothetical protein